MLCFAQWVPGVALLALAGYAANFFRNYTLALRGTEAVKSLGITGDEEIMRPKAHGTCPNPPFESLRWGSDAELAGRLCCFNREGGEPPEYWESTDFLREESEPQSLINFYDSVTGKKLFVVPRGRTFDDFVEESLLNGMLTFRDKEVVAENVRVLLGGEVVSVDGTHLGFNYADPGGNAYGINIVSVSGPPPSQRKSTSAQPGPTSRGRAGSPEAEMPASPPGPVRVQHLSVYASDPEKVARDLAFIVGGHAEPNGPLRDAREGRSWVCFFHKPEQAPVNMLDPTVADFLEVYPRHTRLTVGEDGRAGFESYDARGERGAGVHFNLGVPASRAELEGLCRARGLRCGWRGYLPLLDVWLEEDPALLVELVPPAGGGEPGAGGGPLKG